jgi:phospholipid-binding lipoprotein MlaA
MHRTAVCTFVCAVWLLSGCATGPNKQDPLEPMNRTIHGFNNAVDKTVLRPIAKGYETVVPRIARRGVTNFFRNIGMVVTTVNDALQLKGEKVPVDIMRFAANTVWGLGGLIDVATELNIEYRDEDFGQTLGYWGVKSGPYLVLPFLGPSNFRDGPGLAVDLVVSPYVQLEGDGKVATVAWTLLAVNVVDTRTNLLPLDALLAQQIDPYSFLRDTYLQRREYLIHDGNPPKPQGPPDGTRPKSLRELEEEEFGDEPVSAPAEQKQQEP